MSITLGTLMTEKIKISELVSSSADTDNEQTELNIKLGELLMEHGRHLIEYTKSSATTDAENIGEFFVNWGKYLTKITNVKFVPFRLNIMNPAKYVSVDHLGRKDEWRELYGILEF